MKAEWTNKDSLTSCETTGKAILVINQMPDSCYACPLTYIDYGDDAYYGANTTRCVIDKDTIPRHGKWDGCPLKPIPDKLEPFGYLDAGNEDGLYEKGWNACIDEITGETE